MLEWASPWLFALLPAPLLVWRLLPPHRVERAAVRIPFFAETAAAVSARPAAGAVVLRASALQGAVAAAVWALVVVALARPRWVEPPVERTESARDLLLAVDLSGSMETADFQAGDGEPLQRLAATKQVLQEFIARRRGDRIGLVFFGSAAFLQVPFTRDHGVVTRLLDEARVGMPGPQTVIGDALGVAVKAFEPSIARERLVILLTDGNDTGSRIPPEQAARIAADAGLTVHTIAMGDPNTVGEGALDLELLAQVAEVTGGRGFLALDRDGLAEVYAQIDALEPEELETISARPRRPLYHWPLGLGVGLFFAFHLGVGGAALTQRGRRD